MEAASAFAAVDLGASSGRVVLGVLQGDRLVIKEVHRFENRPLLDAGRLQWDVDTLFRETLAGLARAVGAASQQSLQLGGIGVDSWGVDFALLDDAGGIDGPVLHHRGAGDPSGAIRRRGLSAQQVYERTGVLDQAINTSLRLSDLVVAGAAHDQHVLFVPDLWAYLLTGAIGTDATIASTSQLLDPAVTAWADDLLAAGGIDSLRFPALQPPGTPVGTTTPTITAAIGAPRAIPVFRVGGHDTASAFAFASPAGNGDDAEALISSGTWSVVGACFADPILDPAALEAGFTNETGVHGTLVVQNLNGMWVLQECLREWAESDGAPTDLDELLGQARALRSNGPTFDAASEALLGPGGMVGRVIALIAEGERELPGARPQIVRAILDSLAAAYARSLRNLARLGDLRFERVRLVGGGSRNRLLCQLTADATGLPVLAGPAEASSIGNLAVQAAASRHTADVGALYDHLSGSGADVECFEPSIAEPLVASVSERD